MGNHAVALRVSLSLQITAIPTQFKPRIQPKWTQKKWLNYAKSAPSANSHSVELNSTNFLTFPMKNLWNLSPPVLVVVCPLDSNVNPWPSSNVSVRLRRRLRLVRNQGV